jgi:hypothetical protein
MSINWDSKVLHSLEPVINNLKLISIDFEKLKLEAQRLAQYDYSLPPNSVLTIDPEVHIRKTMLINTLNFAFTDFETSTKYQLKNTDGEFSDTDAMVYQINKAIEKEVPILDGSYMATITEEQFHKIFSANISMPMHLEKIRTLNEVGEILCKEFDGDWLNFITVGPKKLYHEGEGLIERLILHFKRFDDFSNYNNHSVYFLKLAQLAYWGIHRELSNSNYFFIEDMENMTAFADYIIPVALNQMDITSYTPGLNQKIAQGELIEKDSLEEIEIRAVTLFVTAKLTEEINKLKSNEEKIIIPQLDFRLWTEFHANDEPHHLTKTTMY